MSKNIQVYVRLRPVFHDAGKTPEETCVRAILPGKIEMINWRNTLKTLTYDFSQVFDEDSTQDEMFGSTVQPLLSKFIDLRQNVSIFAYGPTGSGKTHTILGYDTEPGFVPRTMHQVFTKVRKLPSLDVKLLMSYIEIYQEKVYDLLEKENSNKTLEIRQDSKNNIFINGITETEVDNFSSFEEVFLPASRRRKTHKTKINSRSSRSHCILQIKLIAREKAHPHLTQVAKLSIVDLAGSEDNRRTGNTGMRLKESSSINTSLHILGKVVEALKLNNGNRIPYRDSKLTRILRDSLGGPAHTSVVVNISPEISSLLDTQSALNFASKTKCIENRPFTHTVAAIQPISSDQSCVASETMEEKTNDYFLHNLIEKYPDKFSNKKDKLDDLSNLINNVENRESTVKESNCENKMVLIDDIRKSTNMFKILKERKNENNNPISNVDISAQHSSDHCFKTAESPSHKQENQSLRRGTIFTLHSCEENVGEYEIQVANDKERV